jgi:V-type H+-transporting ATPase proteolipid subunit
MASGLITGISSLFSGISIGIVGDIGLRAVSHQPKFLTGFILILIFCEMIGLFGLIVGLMVNLAGNKK